MYICIKNTDKPAKINLPELDSLKEMSVLQLKMLKVSKFFFFFYIIAFVKVHNNTTPCQILQLGKTQDKLLTFLKLC